LPIITKLGLIGMQLLEKYKENFETSKYSLYFAGIVTFLSTEVVLPHHMIQTIAAIGHKFTGVFCHLIFLVYMTGIHDWYKFRFFLELIHVT
jgi:hypothetical protein